MKIKISEGHKRIFYLKDLADAQSLLICLNFGARYLSPARTDNLSEPSKRYEPAGESIEACILGEGSYGKVYKAFDKLLKREVAIKQINKSKLGPEEMQLMYQEIELCHILSADESALVVSVYDVYEDSSSINLVMELF